MIYRCTLVFQGPLLARIFFQEEKEEEKRARSSKGPRQDIARNARKVKKKRRQIKQQSQGGCRREARKVEEKRARSSNYPKKDIARNARKVEEKNEENTVVSKIGSLLPKGKPQGWKIPSSLTGVS